MATKYLFIIKKYFDNDGNPELLANGSLRKDYQFVIANDFTEAKQAVSDSARFLWSGRVEKEFDRLLVNLPDIDLRDKTP